MVAADGVVAPGARQSEQARPPAATLKERSARGVPGSPDRVPHTAHSSRAGAYPDTASERSR